LRERIGLDDIISVIQQNRWRWYGHVLRNEDNDWVKKCMEYEVEVPDQEVNQRRLGQRLCKKTAKCKLNREDAMDRSRWRNQIKDD